MANSLLFLAVSIIVWIARRSGEEFGYNKALADIKAATDGKLLDLQTKIKERQKIVEETHAKYEKNLPDVWPESDVIELHKREDDKGNSDTLTSADVLDPRD